MIWTNKFVYIEEKSSVGSGIDETCCGFVIEHI